MSVKIFANNLTTDSTLTASSSPVGAEKERAVDYRTSTVWKPGTATWWIKFDFGAAVPLDYVMLAGHNLGTDGSSVQVDVSDDDAIYDPFVASFNPANDNTIIKSATQVSKRYMKVSGAGAVAPAIGHISAGVATELPGDLGPNFIPPELGEVVNYSTRLSDYGLMLGSSIVATYNETRLEVKLNDSVWMEANWSTLYESMKRHPFGVLYDSVNYPDKTFYAWPKSGAKSLQAKYSNGTAMFYDITMDLQGEI